MPKQYFSRRTFEFLRDLEANNEKAWWEANKDRYVADVREPALDFIADFGSKLHGLSPHFVADTRLNGGSLMRPYRDVRFSSDKTPYKTNVGIQFRHAAGKDVHAPGFYLHLAPSDCFTGAGMWRPETKVAKAIREQIYERPDAWRKATRSRRFLDAWDLDPGEDEMLKRVPREFDPEFPFADDLRMKSFIASMPLTQKTVTSNDLAAELERSYRAASGLTRFLCEAVGLPY